MRTARSVDDDLFGAVLALCFGSPGRKDDAVGGRETETPTASVRAPSGMGAAYGALGLVSVRHLHSVWSHRRPPCRLLNPPFPKPFLSRPTQISPSGIHPNECLSEYRAWPPTSSPRGLAVRH